MEKLYYSISEVSTLIGEPVSKVRFWTNSFPKFIKPNRTNKGNRQYTKEDIETLKVIQFMVGERGLTLEGAAKEMASNSHSVDKRVKALESLKEIRAQLVEIKHSL